MTDPRQSLGRASSRRPGPPPPAGSEVSPSPTPPPRVFLVPLPLLIAGCLGGADLERPVLLQGTEPIQYPMEMWQEGVEGHLKLKVLISEEGVVDSVVVHESSGSAVLDSAAVRGSRDLRFEPGRKRGKLVRMWATLPIYFTKTPQEEAPPR
jgi:periplasmic protein TonB